MYTRYPNTRFPSHVRVPAHYSGNAFPPPDSDAPQDPPIMAQEPEKTEAHQETDTPSATPTGLLHLPKLHLDIKSLFSGGIGTEELLLLGMILLLLGNEGSEDIILLLVLLFFIR